MHERLRIWAWLIAIVLLPVASGHGQAPQQSSLSWPPFVPCYFPDLVELPTVLASDAEITIAGGTTRHLGYFGSDPNQCGEFCGIYHQWSDDGLIWSPSRLVPGSEKSTWLSTPAIAGDRDARVYVSWNAGSVYVTWSDDKGNNFAGPLKVSGDLDTAWGPIDMLVDSESAVHVVWLGAGETGGWDIFYVRSLPRPRGSTDAPVFLEPVPVTTDGDNGGGWASVGVDAQGYVSLLWTKSINPSSQTSGQLFFTRSYQGSGFPAGKGLNLYRAWGHQLVISEPNVITVIADADPIDKFHIYTLVSFNGGSSFAGPFLQTPGEGHATNGVRFAASTGRGVIKAAWTERMPDQKWWETPRLVYAESRNFGLTFPRRQILFENTPDKTGHVLPSLAVTSDGQPVVTDQGGWFTQCEGK